MSYTLIKSSLPEVSRFFPSSEKSIEFISFS
jgi:hypothetical protein